MVGPQRPLWRVREQLAAVAAHVTAARRRCGAGVRRGSRMEGAGHCLERDTGPAVAAQVKRVLVPLRFVLVLEPIVAEAAFVLLDGFVGAAMGKPKP